MGKVFKPRNVEILSPLKITLVYLILTIFKFLNKGTPPVI